MNKDQLLAELRLTRAAIATDVAGLRHELDFRAKIDGAVRQKPWMWFGSAAAVGWWLAGPKTRTRVVTKTVDAKGHKIADGKKVRKEMGFLGILLGLLRFAFPYLKPTLMSFATRQAAQWISASRK